MQVGMVAYRAREGRRTEGAAAGAGKTSRAAACTDRAPRGDERPCTREAGGLGRRFLN